MNENWVVENVSSVHLVGWNIWIYPARQICKDEKGQKQEVSTAFLFESESKLQRCASSWPALFAKTVVGSRGRCASDRGARRKTSLCPLYGSARRAHVVAWLHTRPPRYANINRGIDHQTVAVQDNLCFHNSIFPAYRIGRAAVWSKSRQKKSTVAICSNPDKGSLTLQLIYTSRDEVTSRFSHRVSRTCF